MARLARVVVPGLPHFATQSGNHEEPVFFEDDDFRFYLELVSAAARRSESQIWAYCLTPKKVQFILAPSGDDGLRATFAEAHRQYTARINARFHWSGHLWHGRFHSVVMDDRHVLAAAHQILTMPVRLGLVGRAEDWPWSSIHAHLDGQDSDLVTVGPLKALVNDVAAFVDQPGDELALAVLQRASSTGRPAGSREWICALEARTHLALAPRKRGPKRAIEASEVIPRFVWPITQ